LVGVRSISALGYVMSTISQFITSADTCVIPHVRDGTVFIPANLISSQLLSPMHHVVMISDRTNDVIACLPQAFCSFENNGVVLKVPSPGAYRVVLYCNEGVRRISMRVVAPSATGDYLSVNEGISCELLQPVVPVQCRLSSIKCRDGCLVVGVEGSKATFGTMKIGVWFCCTFPLGDSLLGKSQIIHCACFYTSWLLKEIADATALVPHRSAPSCSGQNKGLRTVNKFESGLRLGHEPLYILNRKKQSVSWLGVSLPRPSLVSLPLEVASLRVFASYFFDVISFCSLELWRPKSDERKKGSRSVAPPPPAVLLPGLQWSE
jgi:hypothetical protein